MRRSIVSARRFVGLVLLLLWQGALLGAAEAALPKVRVGPVRRVFHNGEHNAFTDHGRFKGTGKRITAIYLAELAIVP